MNFENKTVLVTGAAGNLGQAVAAAFAAQGARLVLLGRSVASLQAALGEAGEQRLYVAADLLDGPQVAAALAAAVQRFGRIDVLCNLAGGFRMGDAVHETTDSTWDFLMDINARTLLNMAKSVVPHLLAHGAEKSSMSALLLRSAARQKWALTAPPKAASSA